MRRTKNGMLLSLVTALGACGTNDSTTELSIYTGKTTPANITAVNADDLVKMALNNIDGGYDKYRAYLLNHNTITKSETTMGTCTGASGRADKTYTLSTGLTSITTSTTTTFLDYCVSNTTANGSVAFSSTVDSNDLTSYSRSATLNKISIKTSTNTETVNSSMTATGKSGILEPIKLLITRYEETNTLDSEQHKLESVDVTVDDMGNKKYTIAAGRVYTRAEGYVDIKTTTAWVMDVTDKPTSGTIEITGASGSKAVITANAGNVSITVDADGNGVMDGASTAIAWTSIP